MQKDFERFQVSQVGVLIRNNKCLIVEFNMSDGRVDCWGLPGGRLDKEELSEPAFRREIREELGLDNFKIAGVVDYDIWYVEAKEEKIPVCGIASLIVNETDEIVLSDEHLQYKWINREQLKDYNFLWPNAKRMLNRGFDYLNNMNAEGVQ